jgi:hypothetical protein
MKRITTSIWKQRLASNLFFTLYCGHHQESEPFMLHTGALRSEQASLALIFAFR